MGEVLRRRLAPLREADLSRVEALFTDVDGTLTTGGKLGASTLGALEALAQVGIPVVLVSGRPSGWGECWARQWPVAGVVVENGGLYFVWRKGRLVKIYAQPPAERRRNRRALERHVERALAHVKGARRSMDSAATEVDLAIDYAEDAALGAGAALRLEGLLTARGVSAVRSSVHVNCWLGRFDKASTVKRFLEREWGTTLRVNDPRYVYVGDSLNDAPMFAAFGLSVGVANVIDVVQQLDERPAYVTRAREGAGFIELVKAVVRARERRRP